ncbi:hypothetical protein BHU72_10725 [Desulfuribacillus stibiiarsenatis]|uniref:Uncharacterized protein n=1 Tax=Desulfuribacillus stibiiarsenatis TaxID=1390249 RepID=A0A1E5L2D4_9FIRM|nr:hypothetical protein BHU72_10725 [Desulfuribacillus stibiiarsenatis]
MTNSIIETKKAYNASIDQKAFEIAQKYVSDKKITIEILRAINELYQSAKLNDYDEVNFESAYHNPITSDVEFLIARVIYHIASFKDLYWKVLLRRQKNKCAPDIRIEHEGNTLFVIEIKVKAGWIQQIFSDKRVEHDKERFEKGLIDKSPERKIIELKEQFEKYQNAFDIKKNKIFVLIASLSNVHRKKYLDANIKTYKDTFLRNSNLPEQNLVVLSDNLDIDLSSEKDDSLYRPSEDFETMLKIMFSR